MKPKPLSLSPLAAAICLAGSVAVSAVAAVDPDALWLDFDGKDGLPGSGKSVVLVGGDEEYRSEEALPQLAKILSERHGFDCRVVFSIDPETGVIDPNNQVNLPGLDALDGADLMIIASRFRRPPDSDMAHFERFLNAGKPVIGLRTATHAFNFKGDDDTSYRHWSFNSNEDGWKGGFGRRVLGETWTNHHGGHKSEAQRGVLNEDKLYHPVLRGVEDQFGPTDVYGTRDLPDDATVLVYGQVIAGMGEDDPPVEGKKNDPMQAVTWIKDYESPDGEKTGQALCSTFFSSIEMQNEGIRRMLVNAVYFFTGLTDEITPELDVAIVGKYEPTMFGFEDEDYFIEQGVKPADLVQ